MEESFFLRSATSTGSSMATTSVAGTTRQRGCFTTWGQPSMASGRPTSSNCASGQASRNDAHAGRVAAGPMSPPMQSTAMVIMAMFCMQHTLCATETEKPSSGHPHRTGPIPAKAPLAPGQRQKSPHSHAGRCRCRRLRPARGRVDTFCQRNRTVSGFGIVLQNLATPVETVGADVVAQVGFTRGRLHGNAGDGQGVVRTVHAALGRRLLVLLDSHVGLLGIR